MRSLLYLVHRIPYPPNKGDKVRSYHLLRYLARRYRVFLGTFVDDPDDLRHVETVRALCTGLHVERLHPALARLRGLAGFATGDALTIPYYRSARLQAWVDQTLADERIDTAVLFSSAMVQYVANRKDVRRLIDFVDVDSAKWTQYSESRPWPLSWLYRREGSTLLAYESAVASQADAAFFVTDAEVELFRRLAPGAADRAEMVGMGVDASYFSATARFDSPFPRGEIPLVFTGAMDYWPNADAACWFAADVLPEIRKRHPQVRFYVVGMRPSPAVKALSGTSVVVTGTVPDVRPYLRHAAVVVAPLRVARGIQSKILEAMAMGKAVVASEACATGIDAQIGRDLVAAADTVDFVERVETLITQPERATAMGAAARARVVARYNWDAQLGKLDRHFAPEAGSVTVPE